MDQLIFIDTNIFLDFYRFGKTKAVMQFLDKIDKNHDKIIITDQIGMEFKKHRHEVIGLALSTFKNPKIEYSDVPLILNDVSYSKAIKKANQELDKEYKKHRKKIYEILEEPSKNDEVYKTLEKLVKNAGDISLHRNNNDKFKIRKLAIKRFYLGYPPRKKNDTSIGDPLNWEWIIECCKRKKKGVIIVSRDGDYGSTFKIEDREKAFINEALEQEFSERVGKNEKLLLTTELSFAFKDISTETEIKEMQSAEDELIDSYLKDIEDWRRMRDQRMKFGFDYWDDIKSEVVDIKKKEKEYSKNHNPPNYTPKKNLLEKLKDKHSKKKD